MNNYFISFDENQNPIIWMPTILPKGQLESYLKFMNKMEKESEKTNGKSNNNTK